MSGHKKREPRRWFGTLAGGRLSGLLWLGRWALEWAVKCLGWLVHMIRLGAYLYQERLKIEGYYITPYFIFSILRPFLVADKSIDTHHTIISIKEGFQQIFLGAERNTSRVRFEGRTWRLTI